MGEPFFRGGILARVRVKDGREASQWLRLPSVLNVPSGDEEEEAGGG